MAAEVAGEECAALTLGGTKEMINHIHSTLRAISSVPCCAAEVAGEECAALTLAAAHLEFAGADLRTSEDLAIQAIQVIR